MAIEAAKPERALNKPVAYWLHPRSEFARRCRDSPKAQSTAPYSRPRVSMKPGAVHFSVHLGGAAKLIGMTFYRVPDNKDLNMAQALRSDCYGRA